MYEGEKMADPEAMGDKTRSGDNSFFSWFVHTLDQ